MIPFPKLTACLAVSVMLPGATPKDTTFQALAKALVEESLRNSPEFATVMGDHRWDDRLADFSASGFKTQLAWARHMVHLLEAIQPNALTPENRVDRAILLDNLHATIQDLAERQSWRRNPMLYNPGGAIDNLLSRDFALASQRLASVKGRLLQVPQVLAAARANLTNPPRIYTETAIQQFQGTLRLVRDEVTVAASQAGCKEELAPAQSVATKALEDFISWMKGDLLPRSHGDFRVGAAAFRKQLRTTLSSSLTPEQILDRAERSLKDTRQEMAEVARPLFTIWFPDRTEKDDRIIIKAVLDHIAQKHPDNDHIVALANRDLAEATAFVRSHDLVTIPSTPVKIKVMPEYARGFSVAYCDAPGPLETNGTTFFAISPTPADWSKARVESFFHEYNDAMVADLTVHEAMPGHYLQLSLSNAFRGQNQVRTIFSSGLFAEGWAVYAEQTMARAGFGGPEVHLEQLKMRLRVAINAILDQKIHTKGMTKPEAIALMRHEGFQEEGEAVGKWTRACLSSTQLSTYFVGASEMDDLRGAAETKAKREGKPFDLRAFHDQLLSYGTPAPKFVRYLMKL